MHCGVVVKEITNLLFFWLSHCKKSSLKEKITETWNCQSRPRWEVLQSSASDKHLELFDVEPNHRRGWVKVMKPG